MGLGLSTLVALLGAIRPAPIAYVFLIREGLPAPADDGGAESVTSALRDGGFEPRAIPVASAGSDAMPRDPTGQREVLQRLVGDAHGIVAFWVERSEDGSLLMRAALLSRTDFEVAPGIRGTFTGDLERVVDVGSREERAAAIERLSLRAVARLKNAAAAAAPAAVAPDHPPARPVSLPAHPVLAVLPFSRDWLVAEQDVQASYGELPLRFRFQDRVYDLLNDLRQAGPPWDGVSSYRLNRSEQVTYARMFAPVLVIGAQANPRVREEQLKALCAKTKADGLVFGHLHMEPGKPLYLYLQFFLIASERWYTHRSEWNRSWESEDVMAALRTSLEAVGRQAAEELAQAADTVTAAPRSASAAAHPPQPPISLTPLSTSQKEAPSVTYRIRRGDGFYALARKCYGARGQEVPRTANQIEAFNRIAEQSLEVDQRIQLPRLIDGLRLRGECGAD